MNTPTTSTPVRRPIDHAPNAPAHSTTPASHQDNAGFEAMRDRVVKREAPVALIEMAVLVSVLSLVNFLLNPSYRPYFHVIDLCAALIMLSIGLWLRRESVPARVAPWGVVAGIVVLATALLIQVWISLDFGPTYVLIVLCILGPITLTWRPFLTGAVIITAGVAAATFAAAGSRAVDWTFLAVTASVASAVLLQLRLRSIKSEASTSRALDEENQRLELVLGSSRLGLWDWDMRTDELVCDDRWAEILGYQLDDLGPLSIDTEDRLVHPDDRPRSDALFEAHLSGKVPFYDIELRMRHRDGHWVWVHDRGRIVEWAKDGAALRMTGTLEDASEAHLAAEQLAAAEEESRLAMDNAAIGMCLVTATGALLRVNPALSTMLQEDTGELLGLTLRQIAHPDDAAAIQAAQDTVVHGLSPSARFVIRYVTAGGRVLWGDTSVSSIHNADGSVRHLVVQIVDVSTERALRDSLEEAQRIAHVGSWHLDLPTGALTWSDELLLMFGLDTEGSQPTVAQGAQLFEPGSLERLEAAVTRTRKGGPPYELELEIVRGDGTHGWILTRGEAIRDAGGSIMALRGVALDITARRIADDQLQHLATHDPLTGLANRTALNDEIDLALRAGRRSGRLTGVLMTDLDHFKDVNDTLGHATGDQLLVAAADRLSRVVRAGDLVARTGGDEFVIVMRDLEGQDEALQVARRIVEEFRQPFHAFGSEQYATASVGVTTSTRSSDAGDLIRESDTAMYVAKEQGRDRVSVFNEGLRAVATARVQIEVDLRHAFERGELAVWYQPEIDLTTGGMPAVEALLRWHHPDGNTWVAGRFADVAERTGLILDIGDWVLREACTQGARWASLSPDRSLTVAVNVSALQLAEGGLLDALDVALTTSGLDPSLLCLEVTETALLHQTTTATNNFAGIRDRGVRIAIDDFGTGYASLSYLRDYPIDILKIDRSFVTNIVTQVRDARIVAGIIALARALEIEVTAEGVENQEQAERLRRLGCPVAQGFLFSEAISPDLISERLLQNG